MQEMQAVQTAADAAMAEAGSIALNADLTMGTTNASTPDTSNLYEIVKPGPSTQVSLLVIS